MVHRGLLILLAFAVFNKDCLVKSAPCEFFEYLFGDDDDSEEMTSPKPQTITVLLTPTADLSSLSSLVGANNGQGIYLLPSLLPLGSGDSKTTTEPTTTTTTTTAATTTTTTPAPTTAATTTAAPAAAEDAPAG